MSQATLRLVEGPNSMDKTKALDAALSQIERSFGKGSIMRLGANQKPLEIEAISTGSLGLDIALGIGGLPKGRVVEIYGPESSGKTTLALHTVAEAQKKGGICALHRCGACARYRLCQETRRQSSGSARVAARYRRTGTRNLRHVGAVRRGRYRRSRFRRRTDAEWPRSRARWATCSPVCRRG